MKIDGACHCGYISYAAEVNPDQVAVCHCTDCQVLTGSAFTWMVPAAKQDLRFGGGEPQVYIKMAESGRPRAQGFCPRCGTRIYSTDPKDPQIFNLRVSTSRQRRELPPKRQIWCRSALGWVMELAPVAQLPKQ